MYWIKTTGIQAPLVIGELVKDSEKRWRHIQSAPVATAGPVAVNAEPPHQGE